MIFLPRYSLRLFAVLLDESRLLDAVTLINVTGPPACSTSIVLPDATVGFLIGCPSTNAMSPVSPSTPRADSSSRMPKASKADPSRLLVSL